MTFISTCGDKLIAVSIKNHLKIINARDGLLYFQYTNNAATKDATNNGISFVCHSFSKDQLYFAALTEDKKLLTWSLGESTAKINQNIELPKRPTWLTFLNKEKSLLAADKYGDIYKCSLDSTAKPTLILGHLSMVLTVGIGPQDKYIISGDRDEKIRVSYHPNAYSIHSYCLGHKKLVSCTLVCSETLLLSTSADKTLKLWDFVQGEELDSLDLSSYSEEKEFVPSQLAIHGNYICLIAEKCSSVQIFEIINGNKISHISSHTVSPHQPLSISAIQNGSFAVLTTNKEKPVTIFTKSDKNYAEDDSSLINSELQDVTKDLPDGCSYLTNLVKPIRGKRDNSLITPEATINYDSSSNIPNKMQKLQEEEKEEEIGNDKGGGIKPSEE